MAGIVYPEPRRRASTVNPSTDVGRRGSSGDHPDREVPERLGDASKDGSASFTQHPGTSQPLPGRDRRPRLPRAAKQAPTRTPGPVASRGCLAVIALVTPQPVTVGAPLGRARLVRPEQVGWATRIVVGQRATLQLGPVGFGLLAECAHRVLQPPPGSRVHRPRRRTARAPAVPIDHSGGPAWNWLRAARRSAAHSRSERRRPSCGHGVRPEAAACQNRAAARSTRSSARPAGSEAAR
jgi:hypothetical protein